MSRTLSAVGLAAAFAQHTDEAFIILVTFTHVPTSETYRACLNTEDITSNGEVYTATYFEIILPEDTDRGPQGCQITVDNIDRQLVNLLRSITAPLQVTVQVVLASQPNTVEMEFTDLVLREANWDATVITGTLVSEDPLNQAFPGHVYGPTNFEGIF